MTPDVQKFIQSAYGVNADKLSQVEVKRMTLSETQIAEGFSQPKRCYDNAFHLSLMKEYRYVLGIAVGLIPFEHAWCLSDDGRMIDPTQQLFFPDDPIEHYSLITIRPEELFDIAEQTGGTAPMLHSIKQLDHFKQLFVDHAQFWTNLRKAS